MIATRSHRGLPCRTPRISLALALIEAMATIHPLPGGHDWGNTTYPLAGETVVTPDGQVGIAMHTCPGRPLLPPGGQHRYVHLIDGEPALAWHITQLRPFAAATEVN